MASRKTILHLEVDSKQFSVQYTGSFELSDDKAARKHDERIMDALISDERLFRFFNRLVEPVQRFKRREAKKQAKAQTPKQTITRLHRENVEPLSNH